MSEAMFYNYKWYYLYIYVFLLFFFNDMTFFFFYLFISNILNEIEGVSEETFNKKKTKFTDFVGNGLPGTINTG